MDALLAYIPDWINYWLVAFVVSLLLNVYQFATARDLSGTIKHMLEHGQAPEGKAIVPAASVTAGIGPPSSVQPKPSVTAGIGPPSAQPKGYL